VQRRRWIRVSSRAALGGAVLLLLTSCSASDLEKRLRFGWPTGVTKQAERMRVLWSWSGVVALAMGVLVWGLIFWACGRYHKRNDEIPKQTKYNLPIEIVYTVVPLMIVAGLFFFTVRVEDYVNIESPNPNVTVQVNAFKWNWQFEYLKANGTDQNYPGVTPPQPLSTVGSSGEIAILLIPRGQTVQFVEHSEDVIHSFWVPEFLFKRDVIPYGTDSTTHDNRFEITATANGHYVGRCAELCGTYHSQMNFEVRVVDPDKFTSYLSALSQLGPTDPARQYKALAAIGEVPVATTTHPFNTNRTTRSASN
jgi:cytochrome c oxidase subunit 2